MLFKKQWDKISFTTYLNGLQNLQYNLNEKKTYIKFCKTRCILTSKTSFFLIVYYNDYFNTSKLYT